ncbi:CAP domain-containing protein [Thermopolyspora sp. NPDC052614]|uniref:CAP domain-containing protein n=1 Tax=Thermopolyspora sp. NPDC052614 TaxID=3155682 RepID=UPI003432A8FE
MRALFRALACIGGAAAVIAPATAASAHTRTPVDTETCKVSVTRLVATKTSIRTAVERTGCEEPTFLRAEIRIERFGPDKVIKRARKALDDNGLLFTSARCSFKTRSYYVVVTDSDGNFAKSDPVRLRCGSRFGFDHGSGLPSGSGGSGSGSGSGGTTVGSATENEVIRLTNEHRKKVGCAPLVNDARLHNAALAHTKLMAAKNQMQHQLAGEPDFGTRIKAAGFSFRSAAENIAAGQPTPQSVVSAWINSPGHRANIENCGLTHIGVGVAQASDGKLFWTQDFARPL